MTDRDGTETLYFSKISIFILWFARCLHNNLHDSFWRSVLTWLHENHLMFISAFMSLSALRFFVVHTFTSFMTLFWSLDGRENWIKWLISPESFWKILLSVSRDIIEGWRTTRKKKRRLRSFRVEPTYNNSSVVHKCGSRGKLKQSRLHIWMFDLNWMSRVNRS